MNEKEFLGPTKGKIILSILVPIIVYIFILFSAPYCKPCSQLKYESWPEITSSCDCIVGSGFPEFIKDVIIVFLIPFILTYLIYSFISYVAHRKKE